jgi:hypothetical protein
MHGHFHGRLETEPLLNFFLELLYGYAHGRYTGTQRIETQQRIVISTTKTTAEKNSIQKPNQTVAAQQVRYYPSEDNCRPVGPNVEDKTILYCAGIRAIFTLIPYRVKALKSL